MENNNSPDPLVILLFIGLIIFMVVIALPFVLGGR